MKLPVDKKSRMIVFAGIGGAAMLVLFAAVMWGLLPVRAARREMETSLVSRREQISKAKREFEYVRSLVKSQKGLTDEIEAIRARCVLRPTLGAYLVGVSDPVESAARACGVKIEEIREIGIVDIPQKARTIMLQSFKCYSVNVSAEGSYGAICAFLKRMEQQNPFFCVTELGIAGQADAPESQRVTIRMEWPIEPATEKQQEGTP
jgi:hypothetical protein